MITHWNCQICKQSRPDTKISVLSYPMKGNSNVTINTKYCNDSIDCTKGANKKRDKGEL